MNPRLAFTSKDIKDLLVIEYESKEDFRGENFETFNSLTYDSIFSENSPAWALEKPSFVVDSFSRSTKNVLRGLHGDSKTWKLIEVLFGKVFLMVVDLRPGSETYRNCAHLVLSDRNRYQILVPKSCVNGHMCLSENCLFHYKLTHSYVPIEDQIYLSWISYKDLWPTTDNLILSERDRKI